MNKKNPFVPFFKKEQKEEKRAHQQYPVYDYRLSRKNRQNPCRWYKSFGLCSTSNATAFVNKFPSL
jgi:hypothetical protein